MDKELENTFLAALEQNQQKLLRICSVYATDAEDKKDLFQEVLVKIILRAGLNRFPCFKSRQIYRAQVSSKIVWDHYIHELFETGVSGYILKDSSGRDIVKAIHAAMNDETFLSPSISKVLVDTYRSPRKSSSGAERYKQLSNREREVFQLIAEGHTTRQIADMLYVSVSTVKSHRAKIMEKLVIDTSVKLVHFAIQYPNHVKLKI